MQKTKLKFKLLLLGILTFSIFGLAKNASAGTAFYFDGSDTGSQNLGTYVEPFNTMAKVNQHPFATGDDLYFKSGTTYLVPAGQFLDVDWNGTAGDWVVIGAYYGENQFGLNGGARPVLDGNLLAPSGMSYLGLINKQNSGTHVDGYTEIKDLHIYRSGHLGIVFMYVNYGKVTNCYVNRFNYGGGIQVARSNNFIIEDNVVDDGCLADTGLGAGIYVTGSRALNTTNNNQVLNNTVSRVHGEGIDILQGATNTLVSGNTVYDNLSVQIYVDSGSDAEIVDNIIYKSSTDPWPNNPTFGIMVENEAWQYMCFANNVDMRGNKIANMSWGYALACEYCISTPSCTVNNIKFYDNILTDNDINFQIWNSYPTWTGNSFYNNISYTSNNTTMAHANNYSPASVAWGDNIFDDAVSGNAATEACTVASPLAKTSGWNNLTAGAVSASDFALSSAGITGRTACFGGGGDTTAPSAPQGLRVE